MELQSIDVSRSRILEICGRPTVQADQKDRKDVEDKNTGNSP